MNEKTLTKAQLRELILDDLNALPDGARIFFGNGDLVPFRVKQRGGTTDAPLMQVEFNQLYTVTFSPD